MAKPSGSVAQAVRTYIDKRPVVRDALNLGIVNLSALTRLIEQETGLDQSEAILVACRRHQQAAGKVRGYQDRVRGVLEGSKLEVRTHIAVWTLRASWRLFNRLERGLRELRGQSGHIHILHGSEAVTLIGDESIAKEIEAIVEPEDVVGRRSNLVEVNLRTPDRIEEVPGILAFVTSALSGRDINFVEVISCHLDNMFIIDADDLFAAFEVLNELIRA